MDKFVIKIPRQRLAVLASVTLALAGLTVILILSQRGGWSSKVSADANPRAASAASTTAEFTSSEDKLIFYFSDEAIASVADPLPDHYTFYIENQFIGLITLRPDRKAGQNPESFDSWLAGLGKTITLGGKEIPISPKTVAGREAIAFETSDGQETGYNLVTEFDGRVLWLQSRSNTEVLEKFLSRLKSIAEAS